MITKFIAAILLSICVAGSLFADTLSIPINSGMNDVEERLNNSMYINSSDIELAEDRNTQTIGLRFTGVHIPVGSQINNAYLQFTVDESSRGATDLVIRGDASSPASAFTNSTANVSSRTLTSSWVNWSPPAWLSVGSRGAAQQTPDISAVLQEIVDGNGWEHGQAVVLVITGTGKRVAESFEGNSDKAATLHIDFTPPDTVDDDPQSEKLKVAFIGDQGVGSSAQQVLSLIAQEQTDLLLIQGDLGYKRGYARQWEENLNNFLGENFPVLTVVGNHENFEWPVYQSYIKSRINRVDKLSGCAGEPGVKSFCRYENLDIVQVSPGISEIGGVSPNDRYPEFITESFNSAPVSQGNRWRICTWHKNQTKMQTGGKSNATGWGVYNACLQAGAMIATGHEHAYSRTHLMDDFETQSVVHTNSVMNLKPGNSIAFVSGLGGIGIRSQKRSGDWWASIYTSTQGANYGALFCEFGVSTADCYFKAVDGSIPDRFTLKLPGGAPVDTPGQSNALSIPINSGINDVEERLNTSMYINSSDLELAEDRNAQTVGLRFTDVQLPAGSQINNAYVQFTVDEASSGAADLIISGDATSPAAAFTDSVANISSRTLTSSWVNWSPPAWPSVGSRGAAQQTPDISTVIQEIINGNAWENGQAIVLSFKF